VILNVAVIVYLQQNREAFRGGPAAAQPAMAVSQSPVQAEAPPAWHPDPRGEARLRYWDGSVWTEHTSD
jgi:hypothetical protein